MMHTRFAVIGGGGRTHQFLRVARQLPDCNPFFPAHLYEDQIAVATFLQRMAEYVEGGPSFYSLAESAQDHYLGMMIDKAAETGMPVIAESQVWSC